MIDLAPISVGTGTASGCIRCRPGAVAAYSPIEEITATVRESRGADGVALVGPEPFGHPELPMVIAACREVGFTRIALETDGAALAAHGNAAGALHAGVRHLWVLVLGPEDETHDALTGTPGRRAAARSGVEAYRSAAAASSLPVAVTAVIPVCRHTLVDLAATVASCAGGLFDAVRLVSAGDLPPSAGASVAAACDTGMVNRIWVCTDGLLPLPASYVLHAAPDGGAR